MRLDQAYKASMANLPVVLLDRILLLAGYAATKEAGKVNNGAKEQSGKYVE